MKKFYLYNGSKQYGPYSFAELRHQHILRDTPIWYEGLNEWVIAGSVEELQDILPPASPPPYVVSKSGNQATGFPFNDKASSSIISTQLVNKLLIITGILVFLLLALFIAAVSLR